jgi:lysophospholipase L1-like esterase
MGIAFLLGATSYRFVERPVIKAPRLDLRWSTGLARASAGLRFTAAAAALAMVAFVAMLVARLPTNDPIAESIRAGERELASQVVSSPVPVVTEEPAAPAARAVSAPAAEMATTPAPLPVLPTFRPGSVSVAAIGDSVMVGGAPALSAKLGSSGYIDALKNRQFKDAPQVVRDLRAQGRLGRVLIVHLGNNGPVREEDVEALLRETDGVQNVLLVTVRVDRSWEGSVNDVLRREADRHGNVQIIDWHSYSEGHSDWFYSDGTHLRPAGAQNYANLLAGSIPPPPTPAPTPPPTPKPTPTPIVPLPTVIPGG